MSQEPIRQDVYIKDTHFKKKNMPERQQIIIFQLFRQQPTTTQKQIYKTHANLHINCQHKVI